MGLGYSFITWKMELQTKPDRMNVLGHVYHNMNGIRPITIPIDPKLTDPGSKEIADLSAKYMIDLEKGVLGEIEAKNIITRRLSPAMCPSTSTTCQLSKFLILWL